MSHISDFWGNWKMYLMAISVTLLFRSFSTYKLSEMLYWMKSSSLCLFHDLSCNWLSSLGDVKRFFGHLNLLQRFSCLVLLLVFFGTSLAMDGANRVEQRNSLVAWICSKDSLCLLCLLCCKTSEILSFFES